MLLSRIVLHHWWFLLHAQAAYFSRSEFWRMLYPTGVNTGDWLYIDGGKTVLANNTGKQLTLKQMLSIDLSKSWTTSLVTLNTIEKPASYVTTYWPSLWFDSASNMIYSFGGDSLQGVGSELSIWALLLDGQGGGTWTEKFSPTSAIFSALTRPAYGLSTFSSTAGYSLGGVATEYTSPQTAYLNGSFLALSGLTVFTFDTQNWTNISTSGYSETGWGYGGAAHFISSFGKEGVLVFIGGVVPIIQSQQAFIYDHRGSRRSMDEITIFDIYNQKWYHQTATGDVPAPRSSLCSTGAQETQTGLYEIFVFGGTTRFHFDPLNLDSHQVYILTLPAFRWIRATNSSTASRSGHSCLVIGNRHMLSIGGWDPTAKNATAVVDPWPYGLGIFDMTTLQWTDKYNAAAMPYAQPDQVKTYYSNGSRYPSSWNDSLLEAVFTSSTNASTTTPITGVKTDQPKKPPNPTNTSTITPITGVQTDQAKNPHRDGVIFGSVFGSAGGLAVFIVAVWLWFQKKKSVTRPINERNNTLQFNDAITYSMMPEMAATTPTRPNSVIPLGIKPELAARTSAGLNDQYPYGIKPELAVTTPAGFWDCSNVEENVNLPRAQMLDPEAQRPLPVPGFSMQADEIIELPGSFSR